MAGRGGYGGYMHNMFAETQAREKKIKDSRNFEEFIAQLGTQLKDIRCKSLNLANSRYHHRGLGGQQPRIRAQTRAIAVYFLERVPGFA